MIGFSVFLALVAGQADGQAVGPAAAKEGQTILVLDLTVGPDVRPELPRALSDQLTVLVRQNNPQTRVLGMEDVRSMMALQAQRSRLSCQDVSCLAEIGGALGAKEVVNGSLARIGDNYILTVKRVNAKQVKVIADATRQVPRNHEGDLIEALKIQVTQLFPKAQVRNADDVFGEEEVQSVSKGHTGSYLLMAAGAVGVAALITGAVLYQQFQTAKTTAQTTPVAVDTIASDHDQAVLGTALIFAGAAVASGGALGAILVW